MKPLSYLVSNFFLFINVGMESLLDPVIDSIHRSFLAAIEHRALQVLRPRPPAEIVSIHPDWVDRYVLKYYSLFHFFTPISILTFLFFGKIFLVTRVRSTDSGPSCGGWAF